MTQMKNCNNCTKKKSKHYYESVKPQKLISELNNGEQPNDDYCGRSYDMLPSINTSIPSRANQEEENTFHLHELHKVLDLNYKSLEHGFTRMNDGLWYMASKTTMENCTGEMIEWWFNHCDSTERFSWWHPTCNVHGEYDPTFYAVQPEDRLVGHAIGHRFTCIKKWHSSGTCSKGASDENDPGEEVLQHIDYLHPAEFIETDKLPLAGITACMIGKISYRDHHLGEISVGHVCHTVSENMGNVSLITRMWLGSVDKTDENFPSPRFVNYVGNTLLYRYIRFSYDFIKNLWIQMVQENSCLVAFLPDFYERELVELEQRKVRNLAMLQVEKDLNEFEEFSDEDDVLDCSLKFDEESLPDEEEESMPGSEKVSEQRLVTTTTNDFGEESMSEGEDDVLGDDRYETVEGGSDDDKRGSDEFDSDDDEDDDEGEAQVGGRKGKSGGSASTALVSATSSRVGKGVGI